MDRTTSCCARFRNSPAAGTIPNPNRYSTQEAGRRHPRCGSGRCCWVWRSRSIWWSCSCGKVYNSFEMECLGEEVDQRDLFDSVASGDQTLQIAGQRGRVARDDGEARCVTPRQILDNVLAEAGARRVGQNEIGRFVETSEVILDAGVYRRLREVMRQVA